MDQPLQSKQIQIIDVKPQFIQALQKNKYIISANDGIKYECWDQAWVMAHPVGTFVEIQFYVKQNQSNGRIYTNYVISLPRANTPAVPALHQVSKSGQITGAHILERINLMENNIIDAIRLHCGNDIKIEQDDVPNINAELQINSDIPIIEENGQGGYQGNDNIF